MISLQFYRACNPLYLRVNGLIPPTAQNLVQRYQVLHLLHLHLHGSLLHPKQAALGVQHLKGAGSAIFEAQVRQSHTRLLGG